METRRARGVEIDRFLEVPRGELEMALLPLEKPERLPRGAELGRETLAWKADVRKLKEKGLTESLAIGYRLSPRGEAVLDHGGPARDRAPRPDGTPLPRSIGAPATRALRELGVTTLEQVAEWSAADLLARHGIGPMALTRLREALSERGGSLAGEPHQP